MIISRTPFRISFFGGGTDYPAWYRANGGAVIGGAIDRYCYISVRALPPFFAHKHRIVWSEIELVNAVEEIHHPAVRAVLSEAGIEDGMEIAYNADLPARSGLGTSSSFTVGLLNALYALQGRMVTKKHLAEEAIRVEQDVMGEAVGSQDQMWAAFGGVNRMAFNPDGSIDVAPLILNRERRDELGRSLLLVFTGFSRNAPEIAQKQIDNFNRKQAQLRMMAGLVDQAAAILQGGGDLAGDLGNLMHESWMMKRELADAVSTPEIDAIYEKGREAGAAGGKLLGAGGGGFMLFVTRPEDRPQLSAALGELIQVSFDFDTGGSKIVVFEPDGFAKS